MTTKIAAIIPARMASTRFPGKPLLEIAGLPMVEHVRRRVLLAKGFSKVVVATCDQAIADVVTAFGGEVIMTSSTHQVATERIIETMERLDCTHVVNVQGDEVLVLPSDLEKMTKSIQEHPEWSVWNGVAEIENGGDLGDISIVKGILSKQDSLLYCSRHFSQYAVLESSCKFSPIVWIIGLLAYSRKILENFRQWHRTKTEEVESIEQMRFLENDIPIHAVLLQKAYPGINEPREVEIVGKYLKEDPFQKKILETILG